MTDHQFDGIIRLVGICVLIISTVWGVVKWMQKRYDTQINKDKENSAGETAITGIKETAKNFRDDFEALKKDVHDKIPSLESKVVMLEKKYDNLIEQILRLINK